ncbi:hypothetical protein HYT18_02150 [Candidatus Microgenomates bacterium]|nr:hypothetical protein [Candidatus Microgenomates bacterium]
MKEQDKTNIITGLDELAKRPTTPPLYDEGERNREYESFVDAVKTAYFRPFFLSDQDEKRFWNLTQKLDELNTLCTQLASEFNRFGGVGLTVGMVQTTHGLVAGAGLVNETVVQELQRLSKRNQFEEKFNVLAPLMSFGNFIVNTIEINGISLRDFVNFHSKRTSPIPYLDFLLKAALVDGDVNPGSYQQASDEIFQQNQSYPKAAFPNMTKQAIGVLPNTIGSMSTTDGLEFVDISPQLPPLLREAAKMSKLLCDKVIEIKKAVKSILFNPNSPGYFELKTYFEEKLRLDNKTIRILTLQIMGLNRYDSIFDIYRRSQKMIKEGKEDTFYQLLIDSIMEYAQEASQFKIVTKDDMPTFLDTTPMPDRFKEVIPSTSQFWAILAKLPKVAFQRDYEIDPEKINWGNLYPPQSLIVGFDQYNPKRFACILNYESDTGEEAEVALIVDTSNNTIEWNILDDPKIEDEEEVKMFQDELMVKTMNILWVLRQQVEEEYGISTKSGSTVVVQPSQPIKRERFVDSIYGLRKEVRSEQRQQASPTSFINLSFAQLSERPGIKHQIVIPEDEKLDDLLRHVSSVDKEIIGNAIREYNEKGTGAKWGPLRTPSHDGTPRFKLVIGCTVPKGARVLLRELDSDNGSRTFEILDVRYRKDIYRLNKL